MRKILAISVAACGVIYAAGFKIPEQSGDGVALLASNIATSFGPDAAYYNPANMLFLDYTGHYLESSFSYLQLDNQKYTHHNGNKYTSKKG